METETSLEFTTIRQMLSDMALSGAAAKRCLALAPASSAEEAARRMADTTEAHAIIRQSGNPPLAIMAELSRVLTIAELSALLSPDEIAHVATFLTSCRRMKAYLLRAEMGGTQISLYGGAIHDLSALEDQISQCIRNGQVDDRASDRLSSLRRKISGMDEQIKGKLNSLLRKNKAWFSESYITVRSGRHTLPVRREYKSSVPGALVDMSASGGTCFIEPASVGKLHEELHALQVEEDAEVRRILYALCADILSYLPEIKRNIEAMETLDFLFAKGKLSIQMDASPVRVTDDGEIRILRGCHPLLSREAAVPLDFAIGGEMRGVVITGPNTGGKTVALKTVGLFSLMAQSGLHVPADPSSSICLRDHVLCDIGDHQSIVGNLSTFSSHLTNVLSILSRATRQSLVLLDEVGAGTDPTEGMGIATAILEALASRGCLFVATTHYPEIKEFASNAQGLINARMAFDRESLLPLFRLEIGEAGESCALHIAKRLGMPDAMLRRAEAAAYGSRTRSCAPAPRENGAHIAVVAKAIGEESAEEKPLPHSQRFAVGDSVTVYPRRETGIVYARANERGEIGVQIKGVKRLVPHKRLKLMIPAGELYPDDYDLSIVLDSVANRKARHVMGKRHAPDRVIIHEEGKAPK